MKPQTVTVTQAQVRAAFGPISSHSRIANRVIYALFGPPADRPRHELEARIAELESKVKDLEEENKRNNGSVW